MEGSVGQVEAVNGQAVGSFRQTESQFRKGCGIGNANDRPIGEYLQALGLLVSCLAGAHRDVEDVADIPLQALHQQAEDPAAADSFALTRIDNGNRLPLPDRIRLVAEDLLCDERSGSCPFGRRAGRDERGNRQGARAAEHRVTGAARRRGGGGLVKLGAYPGIEHIDP